MTITIRKLGPKDSADYREIRLESLKLHPESFGATYQEERQKPVLRFESAIQQSDPKRFVVGAFDQEELIGICGFASYTLEDVLALEHTGTIIQMYVRSSYSGQKIGLSLTKAVLREAFDQPEIQQVVLGVHKGNLPALRVYEETGFQLFTAEKGGEEAVHDPFHLMIIHRNEFT